MNEHQPHEQQPEREDRQPEQEPRHPILQIWVADLAAYNNGQLHGRWIETSSDPDAMWVEITDMLRRSPIPGAEEIAIFDVEGFGPAPVGEFTPISTVARITAGVELHGRAFLHWVGLIGTDDPDLLDAFEDRYVGRWDSLTAYADEWVEDCGFDRVLDEHVPEPFRPYVSVDTEALGRDIGIEYLISEDREDGGVHLFQP